MKQQINRNHPMWENSIKKTESLGPLGESLMVQHTHNWSPITGEKLEQQKYLKSEEITVYFFKLTEDIYLKVKKSSECQAEQTFKKNLAYT